MACNDGKSPVSAGDITGKTCTCCGEYKLLSEFYKDSANKTTGRQPKCKSCHNKYCADWRERNSERYQVTQKKRRKRYYHENKKEAIEKNTQWIKENPEKAKEYRKRNYIKNIDRKRAYQLQHRQKQEVKERRNELRRKRRMENEEIRKKEAEYSRMYGKLNPDIVNANSRKRKAKKLTATPVWANDFFIKEAYALAKLRNELTGIKWHVDHIVPLRSTLVCGLHVEHNLQVIPEKVNLQKHNRYWPNMP